MPEIFSLQFPQSLGVFDAYADAQKAVDYLSDEEFPVENCLIVGTDLKQVERVTGRLTTGRVAHGRRRVRRLAGPAHRPAARHLRRRRATTSRPCSAASRWAWCSASSGA